MLKAKNLWIGVGIAAVALAVVLLWQAQRPPEPFRITLVNWIGFGPLYVAQKKGFFDDEGVRVELVQTDNADLQREELVAGKVEAIATTIDEMVVGASRGIKAKMVTTVDTSHGADGIIAVDEIRTIRDLKGKTIAVEPGTTSYFFLLVLLQSEHISPDDIHIKPLAGVGAGKAFLKGKADAAVTWQPFLANAGQRKGAHVLITTADPKARNIIVDNLIVRDDVIQDRRGDVDGVVRAWQRAVAFTSAHPEEAGRIIAEGLDITPAETRQALLGITLFTPDANRRYMSLERRPNSYSELASDAASLYYRQQLITNKPSPRDLIDLSFADQ